MREGWGVANLQSGQPGSVRQPATGGCRSVPSPPGKRFSIEDAHAELDYFFALVLEWDQQYLTDLGDRRHHLAVDRGRRGHLLAMLPGGDTLGLQRFAGPITNSSEESSISGSSANATMPHTVNPMPHMQI
jgi:hypothetical protein